MAWSAIFFAGAGYVGATLTSSIPPAAGALLGASYSIIDTVLEENVMAMSWPLQKIISIAGAILIAQSFGFVLQPSTAVFTIVTAHVILVSLGILASIAVIAAAGLLLLGIIFSSQQRVVFPGL